MSEDRPVLIGLLIIGPIMSLLLFGLACSAIHHRRLRSRFWWTLERIRASIAYEGDPGQWADRKPVTPDPDRPPEGERP